MLENEGKLLVFTSALASSGKTVATLSTAMSLTAYGYGVCIVDGQFQSNDYGLLFDDKPSSSLTDIVLSDGPVDDKLIKNAIFKPHEFSSDVLLSTGFQDKVIDSNVKTRLDRLSRVLDWLRTRYDYVLVEIDLSDDPYRKEILSQADKTILVTIPEQRAIVHTRKTIYETLGNVPVKSGSILVLPNRTTYLLDRMDDMNALASNGEKRGIFNKISVGLLPGIPSVDSDLLLKYLNSGRPLLMRTIIGLKVSFDRVSKSLLSLTRP